LAAHTAAVAYLAYGIIAQLSGRTYLVSFCLTVAGALLALAWFDWSFNARSTEVFLENGGALALGATLAVLALVLGEVLLLPLIGFVFLAVLFSDVLGSRSARVRRGGRRSPVDPLHHSFETRGMSERQVAQRFWLVSMVAGLLGVALALV
jgi:phospho-N-acetylmuramoyl-pentapeptide-transferase